MWQNYLLNTHTYTKARMTGGEKKVQFYTDIEVRSIKASDSEKYSKNSDLRNSISHAFPLKRCCIDCATRTL